MSHVHHDYGRLEIDFFNDSGFSDFHSSLDAEMKRLQSPGLSSEESRQNHSVWRGEYPR